MPQALSWAIGLLGVFCLNGCQVTYLLKSGIAQTNLLRKRVPIDDVLERADFDEDKKAKLRLVQEVRKFAETNLGLKVTKNYTSFVELDRPYVSWAVSAAPRWELKHHLFWFPVVGRLPYKGYFVEDDAKELARELEGEGLDTYVRGVSAYSTLGWTSDPVLSSMLRMEEHDLAELIIHETVHTTLYISSAADFNERLASFIGDLGARRFYEHRGDADRIQKMSNASHDSRIFSEFVSSEITSLERDYANKTISTEEQRAARFEDIRSRFRKNIAPQLRTESFRHFANRPLNNASLLAYKTYWMDLRDFEIAFERHERNFASFLKFCKSLESEKNPEEALRSFVASASAATI